VRRSGLSAAAKGSGQSRSKKQSPQEALSAKALDETGASGVPAAAPARPPARPPGIFFTPIGAHDVASAAQHDSVPSSGDGDGVTFGADTTSKGPGATTTHLDTSSIADTLADAAVLVALATAPDHVNNCEMCSNASEVVQEGEVGRAWPLTHTSSLSAPVSPASTLQPHFVADVAELMAPQSNMVPVPLAHSEVGASLANSVAYDERRPTITTDPEPPTNKKLDRKTVATAVAPHHVRASCTNNSQNGATQASLLDGADRLLPATISSSSASSQQPRRSPPTLRAQPTSTASAISSAAPIGCGRLPVAVAMTTDIPAASAVKTGSAATSPVSLAALIGHTRQPLGAASSPAVASAAPAVKKASMASAERSSAAPVGFGSRPLGATAQPAPHVPAARSWRANAAQQKLHKNPHSGPMALGSRESRQGGALGDVPRQHPAGAHR